MTAEETEQVILLIEECGEVIHAATKILRHGWGGQYDSGRNNVDQLELELGDVKAVLMLMFRTNSLLSVERVDRLSYEKYHRLLDSPHVYHQKAGRMLRDSDGPTETLDSKCPDCGEQQFKCPSGVSCKNGHGF